MRAPLAFKEICLDLKRIVYELISCDCSESLAQVGSKYLEANFHRHGFTILETCFTEMSKRRKNFYYLALLHILYGTCLY